MVNSGTGGEPGDGGIGGYQGGQGTNGNDATNVSTRGTGGIGRTTYSNLPRGSYAYDGWNGAPAEGGYSYGIFDSDVSDGAPVVNGNTITVGTPGTNGQSGEQF